MPGAKFFSTRGAWRDWLEANHASATECVVGFHKAGSPGSGITRPEALDEALCFGWIDGVGRRIDDHTWSIRFTPRQKRSVWSDVNIARVEALKAEGRMAAAGLAAYEGRDPRLEKRYSHENRDVALDPEVEARFRADAAAWTWFTATAPSYRRQATWWVMSAVRPETRERRLATLVADCAAGRRVKALATPAKRKPA